MGTPSKQSGLNWNLLRDFLGYVRYANFSEAADALSIKRPAVSKRVAELEETLGFRLVERAQTGRTVRLTPQGRALSALTAAYEQGLADLLNTAGDGVRVEGNPDPLLQARRLLADMAQLVETLARTREAKDGQE